MTKSLATKLNEVKVAFSKPYVMKLREISNETMKEAALHNDKALAEISSIAYCLHKLSLKEHIVKNRNWPKIKKNILFFLEQSIKSLKSNDLEKFKENIKKTVSSVEEVDLELGHFVLGLYDKAKIKKASEAYFLGMSLSQAVELTGANKKELLDYIGSTKMADVEEITLDIRKRLQRLKKILE